MYVDHSPKVKRAALRLYKTGMTVREIADTVGISCSTVSRWRQSEGLSRPIRGARRYSDQTRDLAMAKYREGVNPTEIADLFGVSATTVRWWARTMGVQRSVPLFRGHHDKETRRRAVELYTEGHSSRYVAEVLGEGIDQHTVVAWVRAAGLRPRPGARAPRLDHREAERLYKKLGTYASVAEVLGCSQSGAFRAVHRALVERVRRELSNARS